MHGLYRSLVNNMVVGVTDGFSKTLELVGTGYRAQAGLGDLFEPRDNGLLAPTYLSVILMLP